MRILYAVGFGDWWGAYPPDILDREDRGNVGGGETCAIRTAAGLVARGHEVTFCGCNEPGEWQGVRFRSLRDLISTYLDGGVSWDAIVSWSDPWLGAIADDDPAVGRVIVQQLNDLGWSGDWWNHVEVVGPASDHHSRYLQSLLHRDAKEAAQAGRLLFRTCHNGVNPEWYPDPPRPDSRPMWVGYWSSPDRGLIHVLDCWPRIRRAVPDARLRVFYAVAKFIQCGMGAMASPRQVYTAAALAEKKATLGPREGVDWLDAVPRRRLVREQMQCRVLCYPCDPGPYTEGFGQAVPEAMLAGCLPVIRPADAFADLWAAVTWNLETPSHEAAFHDEIVEKTVRGLTEWSARPSKPTLHDLRDHAAKWTWDKSAASVEVAVLAARNVRSQC